jgi:Lon protease-like protein
MSDTFDLQDDLKQFTGRAPLFPLPNVVHFPHTWLPLHVFEPRYRAMVEEALKADRLIAMALLKPNQEALYETKRARIHPIVCLGRIAVEERLPDGRFNLALRGLCRARIERELEDLQPYRTAELTRLYDFYPSTPTIDRRHRQRELLSGATEVLPEFQSDPLLHQLLDAEMPLGVLCDVLAHSLGLSTSDAQLLLEEPDVDVRSDLVLNHLRQRQRKLASGVSSGFPPAFSRN